ncbi:7-carboxy-7-deazaguanine synthase QueE [Planomonospora sp. ID91781]|uniref:7-carboxy-7-deazaguanine synthase QueE n=1 Tax=Planomonospora sp. ID91781 TaxID=2738135 RepID=UPI001A1B6DBD|nr:7-carboxy-7-deazaguanine synthase QueE [Planomonospora sp. ID91781]MBG0825706.1 7-carboxy-7-deazaguanine synthase QueE [Planomonospora sp. ID91781]
MTGLMTAPGTAGRQTLLVAERFGPTLQGEGPSSGVPAVFVRLSRCNLSCGFCDTPFTWDTSRFDLRAETMRMTVDDVTAWALDSGVGLVVITGGEPLLQQEELVPLVGTLTGAGRRVEIETNGTVLPHPRLLVDGVGFNVSPKLTNAHLPEGKRIVAEALEVLAASGRAVFKFVAAAVSDLEEIEQLQRRFGLGEVWVMPEGTTGEQVITRARLLAEEVIARGWSLSLRTHVVLWGDERGR